MNIKNMLFGYVKEHIAHYSHKKYWSKRNKVYNKESNIARPLRYYYHYQIRKMEKYSNASIGLHPLGGGAEFKTPPILPHGLSGIFINDKAVIGRECVIYQQVTIGEYNHVAPIIGDNCLIGAGAKLIGGIRIGNNVKIGANCIVVTDIPDNATVVMDKPRIIIKVQDE